MSKRDEIKMFIIEMMDSVGAIYDTDIAARADAIIALLADPSDRMVEAAEAAFDWKQAEECGLHDVMRAAIRAAMKAAGE